MYYYYRYSLFFCSALRLADGSATLHVNFVPSRGGTGTCQMGANGEHNSSWGGRGAKYAAELRI